jgi:hypothetical protein
MKFWKILGYTLVALVLWGCSTDNTTDPLPTPTATIQGNVSSFVPVSGLSTQQLADIDVSVEGTSITTTTDAAGNFILDDVPVGNVMLLFASIDISASLTIENVEEGQIVTIDVQVSATVAVLASIERDTEDYSFDLNTTNFTLDDDDDDTDDNADDTVIATIAGAAAALADIDLDSLELTGDSGSLAPTNAVIVGGQLQAEFNVAALLDVVGDVAGQFEVTLSFQANNITVNVSVFISVEVSDNDDDDDSDDGDADDGDSDDADDGDSDDADDGDSDDGDSDDADDGDSDDADDGDSDHGDADDGDSDDADDGDADDGDADDGDSDDADDGDSDDGDSDDGDVVAPTPEVVGIVTDIDVGVNSFVIIIQTTNYTVQLAPGATTSQSDDGGLTSIGISAELFFQLLQTGVQVEVVGDITDNIIVASSVTLFVNDLVGDDGEPVEDDYDFHVQPDTWNTNYEGNTSSNVAFSITSDDDGAIDNLDEDSIRISIDGTAIPSETRQQGTNQLRALLTRAEAYALIDRPIPGQDYIVTISFTVTGGATVELVDVIDLVGPGQDDDDGDVNVVIDVDIDINNSDPDEGTITVPDDDGDDVDVHINDDTDIIVIDPITQETVSISIDVFFQVVAQGGISLDLDVLTTVEGSFALEIYFEFSIDNLPDDDGDDGDSDDSDDGDSDDSDDGDSDDFDAVDVDVDDVDEDDDSFSFIDSDGVSVDVAVGVNTEIIAVDPVTGESVTISTDVFFQLLLEGNVTLDLDLDSDGDNGDSDDNDDADDGDSDDADDADDGDSDDADDGDSDDADDGDSDDADDSDDGDSDDADDDVGIIIAIKIIVNIDLSLLPSETPDFALALEPTEWDLDWVDNTDETLTALISLDDMMDDGSDDADDGDSDDNDDIDLLDNIDTSTIMLSILDGTTAIMPTDVSLTDDGLEALFTQADAFGLLDDPMADDVVTVLVSFEYGDDNELIELQAEITVVEVPLPVFAATLEPSEWALDWLNSADDVVVTVIGDALADVDLDSFELSAILDGDIDDGDDGDSDDGDSDDNDVGDSDDDNFSDDFPAGVEAVEVNADDNSIQVLFPEAELFNLLTDPEADDTILALLTFDLLDDREIEILLDAFVVPAPDILLSEEVLETDESGTEATFDVVLASRPTAPVNITLNLVPAVGDDVEGELSADILEFDGSNWDIPVTVTVTGLDDEEDDGDITYQVVLESVSNDPGYDELVRELTVTNTDNEGVVDPAIVVSETDLVTSEDGTDASFNVTLATEPTAEVTVMLSFVSDDDEGTLSIMELTFNADTWDIPQTVDLTGEDDNEIDDDVDYVIELEAISNDPSYDELTATVNVRNEDNDSVGVTVDPLTLTTSEDGNTAEFTIALNSQPTFEVFIALTIGDDEEGDLSVSFLTFDANNWDVPQAVTVTGVDDADVDGDVEYDISLEVQSDDPLYNDFAADTVVVTNEDDDTAGITVDPLTLTTSEDGNTAEFTVVLNSEPSFEVIITLDLDDDGDEGSLSTTELIFDANNWDVPQAVTVIGVDDADVDGDVEYDISLEVQSDDPLYNAFDADDVIVTNTDDD